MKKLTLILCCLTAAMLVSAQNLVPNGTFSDWTEGSNVPDGWITDKTTTTIFSQGTPDGLVVTDPGATTKLYTTIAVEEGETYDLTFTYSASHLKFRLWSGWVNTEGQTSSISYNGAQAADPLRTNNDYYPVKTDSTVTVRFTSMEDKPYFRLEFRYYSQAGSTFKLNNVQLVKYVSTSSVATPVISPSGGSKTAPFNVEITTETDGATIRYTLNGEDPTETSTAYTAPFEVSAATTVKAKAFKDGKASEMATVNYTFPVEVADIAAFNTQTAGAFVKITGAVKVVYQNSPNLYVTDGSGNLLVYGSINKTFASGDIITGLTGSYAQYGDAPQMSNPVSVPDATAGEAVLPATVDTAYIRTAATQAADHAKYIKIENVQFTANANFSTSSTVDAALVNGITVRDNFRIGGSYPAAQIYNITGFIAFYNGNVQIFPAAIEQVIPLTPTVYAAEESIPVMAAQVNKTASQEITISGHNLTADIVLTIEGTDSSLFTLDKAAIQPAEGEVPSTVVKITYAPTAAGGPHTATLKINSTGAAETVFTLTGNVKPALATPDVIITEVYGAGGNGGATFKNDFVELYNTTAADINVGGWSLQYFATAGTGECTNVFAFPENTVIKAKNYLLIQLAGGTNGSDLTATPNLTGTGINMAAASGKIILFTTGTAQTIDVNAIASITGNTAFKDYVPFGDAKPVWGTALAALSATTSAQRKMEAGEYVYSQDTGSDFERKTPAPQAGPPASTGYVTKISKIYAYNGKIMFTAAAGEQVDVFNVLGQKIISRRAADGLNTLPVNIKGIAIVKVGNRVAKIRL